MAATRDTLASFFRPGDRIAAAVSGGADSVALFLLLAELAPAHGLQLSIAHFDHRWRPESAAEAGFVRALAEEHKVGFHLGEAETEPPQRDREQAGRRQRYAFFTSLIRAGATDFVATAHTADDQAETVLLRLLRGSGPAGLAGILPRRGDGIVRPLLAFRRAELRAWLEARHQPWREDATNADLGPRRNLLRHRFLPELAAAFNPALAAHLASLASFAGAENEFWDAYLDPLLSRLWTSTPTGGTLPRKELLALPLAVQRRLLRAAVERLQGNVRGLDALALEEVLAWLAATTLHPRRRPLARCTCLVTARTLELINPGAGPRVY